MSQPEAAVTPRRSTRRRKPAGRVAVLDGLRFVAASMVVFYHYAGVSFARIGHQGKTVVSGWGAPAKAEFPPLVHQMAMFGGTGVELFFMISGFVICMSGWGRRPADFFISRVVRLVPAYWAAIGLTAVVLIALPRLTDGVRISAVLANLSMVHTNYGVHNLEPAFWTLLVELTFYLLFGLVAIGGVTYRRMVTFCVLWSVGSFVAAGSRFPLLVLVLIPNHAAYFIAGIAFYLIYRFGGNFLLWAIVCYSYLIAIQTPSSNSPWPVMVLVTAFFVIFTLIATHNLDWIKGRWLMVVGSMTYPLYLIHHDLGYIVFSYFRAYVPAPELAAATYGLMLVCSWLIYRLIERPLAPLLKAKLTEAVNAVRESGPPSRGPRAWAVPATSGLATSGLATSEPAAAGGAGGDRREVLTGSPDFGSAPAATGPQYQPGDPGNGGAQSGTEVGVGAHRYLSD
ncbi:MAG TPA: acyltransferase [Streptosporangiaceae bacterium]|nr:acyltransferase [Streptosporangiaceae bacterium]